MGAARTAVPRTGKRQREPQQFLELGTAPDTEVGVGDQHRQQGHRQHRAGPGQVAPGRLCATTAGVDHDCERRQYGWRVEHGDAPAFADQRQRRYQQGKNGEDFQLDNRHGIKSRKTGDAFISGTERRSSVEANTGPASTRNGIPHPPRTVERGASAPSPQIFPQGTPRAAAGRPPAACGMPT